MGSPVHVLMLESK